MLFVFFLNLVGAVNISSIILNTPSWWAYRQYGIVENSYGPVDSSGGRYLEDRVIKEILFPSEDYKGFMIEVGASDGYVFSPSNVLEKERRWSSVLIEGDPVLAKFAITHRPNALIINAVVCHDFGIVQFAPMGSQGGITHTLSHYDLVNYLPHLLVKRAYEMSEAQLIQERISTVECVPLGWLLEQLNLDSHKAIDFLFIDVNGAEFAVASSIHLDKVPPIYVIAVNIDPLRDDRSPFIKEKVKEWFKKDYIPWQPKEQSDLEWAKEGLPNKLLYLILRGSPPAVLLNIN